MTNIVQSLDKALFFYDRSIVFPSIFYLGLEEYKEDV
jgi:hypothetical protein